MRAAHQLHGCRICCDIAAADIVAAECRIIGRDILHGVCRNISGLILKLGHEPAGRAAFLYTDLGRIRDRDQRFGICIRLGLHCGISEHIAAEQVIARLCSGRLPDVHADIALGIDRDVNRLTVDCDVCLIQHGGCKILCCVHGIVIDVDAASGQADCCAQNCDCDHLLFHDSFSFSFTGDCLLFGGLPPADNAIIADEKAFVHRITEL